MKRQILCTLSLSAALGLGATTVPMPVADNGVTACVIAVPEQATPVELTAARELRDHLEKTSNVRLPIVSEAQRPANRPTIFVGATRQAAAIPAPGGPESWLVRSIDNGLILKGGGDRGTLYAVYHFLEDVIGVYWWSQWETDLPFRPQLTIADIDLAGEPAFAYRDIYDSELYIDRRWHVRNRLNGNSSRTLPEYGGYIGFGRPADTHTTYLIIPPERFFAAHPEYFTELEGKRVPDQQLCLTNPELPKVFAEELKKIIRQEYAEAAREGRTPAKFFSVSPKDNAKTCQCAACLASDRAHNQSGTLVNFVNAVAAEIAGEFPDVLVDTLAYSYYIDPPVGVAPRANVVVRYCDNLGDLLHGIDHPNNRKGLANLEAWSRVSPNWILWIYAAVYSENLPLPSMYGVPGRLKAARADHARGVFFEQEYPITSDLWEMKTWMETKFLENPDADFNQVMNTFTDNYYGPAGKFIREYLELTHQRLEGIDNAAGFGASYRDFPCFDADYVNRAGALLKQAEQAAAGDAVFARRVACARLSFDRGLVLRSDVLEREFARRGETMPDPETAARRVSATLRAEIAFRQASRRDLYCRIAYNEAEAFDRFRRRPAAPLPEQFRAVPTGKILDLPAAKLRCWTIDGWLKVQDDPQSPWGESAQILVDSVNPEEFGRYADTVAVPFGAGQYNFTDRKDGVTLQKYPKDQLNFDGNYHLYKFGPFPAREGDTLYLFHSWCMNIDFNDILRELGSKNYEMYVSLRYEGPAFQPGSKLPNRISVDRVIIVGLD